jgi:hypothetical protein
MAENIKNTSETIGDNRKNQDDDKIKVPIPNQNDKQKVSSPALIGIILVVAVIGLVIMMVFERYLAPVLANKVLLRLVLLGVLINLCILIFLIYSFSRVSFQQGPRGPSGIRGLPGPLGGNASINKCSKQTKTITKESNDRIRAKTIVIEKPAIELE